MESLHSRLAFLPKALGELCLLLSTELLKYKHRLFPRVVKHTASYSQVFVK